MPVQTRSTVSDAMLLMNIAAPQVARSATTRSALARDARTDPLHLSQRREVNQIMDNLIKWMRAYPPTSNYEIDSVDYDIIMYYIQNRCLPISCHLPLEIFEGKKYDPAHFCPSWCKCCEDNLKLKC